MLVYMLLYTSEIKMEENINIQAEKEVNEEVSE